MEYNRQTIGLTASTEEIERAIASIVDSALFCSLLGAATIEKVARGDQAPRGPVNLTSIEKPMSVVFDKEGNWYIAE
jgi:hypothetical protein